ncbi:ABC transporter permease [Nitrosopumilus piranensis]|uniref:Putative O-antigen export system permease protein RfbA n=1 Tax=Nitrosopumilus piranensis TaxID=1582439 RepID=A0A0C5C7M3_9ARCH|nr:ABC transporter permease [Nitrosopumilus piranensis]AJM91252.1 putative O-antigen export system permease protein RfbA [Nitrosopumilus piranensis]
MNEEIKEILSFKSLIFTFAVMDLKLRYRNSILGIAWSFLEPLFILSILNLVFSTILLNNIEYFPIFLILSLVMYNMFTRSTSMSTESMLSKATIIKSVYLKREIFAISSTITAFLMMLIEFSIVIVFIGVFQFTPTVTSLAIPLLVILLFVFSLGISLPLSALNVRFRDTRIIWTVLLQALFFLTPIFYEIDFLPESIAQFVKLNPLALIMELGHNALLYNTWPNISDLSYIIVTSFASLFVGWTIFRKMNKKIDEVI